MSVNVVTIVQVTVKMMTVTAVQIVVDDNSNQFFYFFKIHVKCLLYQNLFHMDEPSLNILDAHIQ